MFVKITVTPPRTARSLAGSKLNLVPVETWWLTCAGRLERFRQFEARVSATIFIMLYVTFLIQQHAR